MKEKQISILGCGWLGLELAKSLIIENYVIKGSTTSAAKLEILERNDIKSYQINLNETFDKSVFEDFLADSKILIISIPPRNSNEKTHSEWIKYLIPIIENSEIDFVIYTSSIGVYQDIPKVISEDFEANPITSSGNELLLAEANLLESKKFKSTILRLGGLVGEDRHPIFSMQGKTNVSKPKAGINLIHRLDIIEIFKLIFQDLNSNEVYNIVYPEHPERQKYYTKKAVENDLKIPEFEENDSLGKIICSEKIMRKLNYKFQHLP